MILCAHCLDGNHQPIDHDPECECDCDTEPDPERACWICDGVGHGYVTGWTDEGHPILSSPCPLEDQGRFDFEDEALPF